MSDGTSEVAVAMVELAEVVRDMQGASSESLQAVSVAMIELAEKVADIARVVRTPAAQPAPRNDDSIRHLIDAIRELRVESKFDPTINVPTQPLALTVAAPAVTNVITVDQPRGRGKVKVDCIYAGDRITGFDIDFGT